MKKKQGILSPNQSRLNEKINILLTYLKKNPEDVLTQAQMLLDQHPKNIDIMTIAAEAAHTLKEWDLALYYADSALAEKSNNLSALLIKSQIKIDNGKNEEALSFLTQAITSHPEDIKAFILLSHTLIKLKRFDDFFDHYRNLKKKIRNNNIILNNYGQALLEIACIEEGLAAFKQSIGKNPSFDTPYANLIVALHYSPIATPGEILKECRNFQNRFLPKRIIHRAKAKNLNENKKIRIGMISGGFCSHPVGSMITHGLSHICQEQIEFYAYSINKKHDHITNRIKSICAKWHLVDKLSDSDLDNLIRQDEIDILFDLSGFNDNSRMQTIMLEPAPIIIKWVGGLISSTGIDAVDYLLSDHIETPSGTDHLYSEKIIRLPDDYICFEPALYTPPVTELPAQKNGYITFGCFNNASKINNILLEKWAAILTQLPTSRLFLKSHAFSSTDLKERVIEFFQKSGIEEERIRLEGASPHHQLLACYNEIDIALDPWPYSGGLTTCEAMIMGVPVITFPGPTFAGRHSATHLYNAGMPELIADSWEHYIQLATNLATDLKNLEIIRENLRFIVLQSPLCDAARFGHAFTNAMRAIWQRHCAGKEPQALTIDKYLTPYFADESTPVELQTAKPDEEPIIDKDTKDQSNKEFQFELEGRIMTVDNGTLFTKNESFLHLKSLNVFQFLVFDPAGAISKQDLPIDINKSIQHFPYHCLGDGNKVTLYATLDANFSSTLAPVHYLAQHKQKSLVATSVVAEAPIFSVKADSIGSLNQIDWLLLSGKHAVTPILSAQNKLTTQALVVQINLPSEICYIEQPKAGSLISHMRKLQFECYDLTNDSMLTEKNEGALLFIPNANRLKTLANSELEKLAFILHSAYRKPELAFKVLSILGLERAASYHKKLALQEDSFSRSINETKSLPIIKQEKKKVIKKIMHIGFNNFHLQSMINTLNGGDASSEFTHYFLIERTQSIPNYDLCLKKNAQAFYFTQENDLNKIVESCLEENVEAIIIHGLFFNWQHLFIKKIAKRKKIIWVIWGGDLYNPIKNGTLYYESSKNIYGVSTNVDGDYDLFCKNYGRKPRFYIRYGLITDFNEIKNSRKKKKQIIIGNSGDPSNLHIEIIKEIRNKKDILDYKIIIPFSYNGSIFYKKEILKYISKNTNIKNIEFLDKILSPESYFEILSESELFIAAHNRQQAIYNTIGALYFGVKTVIRKEIKLADEVLKNPTWILIREKIKAKPIPFENLKKFKYINEIPFKKEEENIKIRKEINKEYGKNKIIKTLNKDLSSLI